jgi:hypothetical protein
MKRVPEGRHTAGFSAEGAFRDLQLLQPFRRSANYRFSTAMYFTG